MLYLVQRDYWSLQITTYVTLPGTVQFNLCPVHSLYTYLTWLEYQSTEHLNQSCIMQSGDDQDRELLMQKCTENKTLNALVALPLIFTLSFVALLLLLL